MSLDVRSRLVLPADLVPLVQSLDRELFETQQRNVAQEHRIKELESRRDNAAVAISWVLMGAAILALLVLVTLFNLPPEVIR